MGDRAGKRKKRKNKRNDNLIKSLYKLIDKTRKS